MQWVKGSQHSELLDNDSLVDLYAPIKQVGSTLQLEISNLGVVRRSVANNRIEEVRRRVICTLNLVRQAIVEGTLCLMV